MNFGCYSFSQFGNKIFLCNNTKERQFVTTKEVWNMFVDRVMSEDLPDSLSGKLSQNTWIRYSRFRDVDYIGIFRENDSGKIDFTQGLNFEKEVLMNALPSLINSAVE